jgi:hypothetical protein
VRELNAGQSFTDPEIKMVECTGANANQNMVFTQLGLGSVFILQDLGSTEFVNADGFHGCSGIVNKKTTESSQNA